MNFLNQLCGITINMKPSDPKNTFGFMLNIAIVLLRYAGLIMFIAGLVFTFISWANLNNIENRKLSLTLIILGVVAMCASSILKASGIVK